MHRAYGAMSSAVGFRGVLIRLWWAEGLTAVQRGPAVGEIVDGLVLSASGRVWSGWLVGVRGMGEAVISWSQ